MLLAAESAPAAGADAVEADVDADVDASAALSFAQPATSGSHNAAPTTVRASVERAMPREDGRRS